MRLQVGSKEIPHLPAQADCSREPTAAGQASCPGNRRSHLLRSPCECLGGWAGSLRGKEEGAKDRCRALGMPPGNTRREHRLPLMSPGSMWARVGTRNNSPVWIPAPSAPQRPCPHCPRRAICTLPRPGGGGERDGALGGQSPWCDARVGGSGSCAREQREGRRTVKSGTIGEDCPRLGPTLRVSLALFSFDPRSNPR